MKLIKYAFLICLITASYSCTKSLDLEPKDSVSDASFWMKELDFELAANEFYWRLDPHSTGLETDIAFNPMSPNSISNGSYLPPETDSNWDGAYRGIRSTSYLIERADESPVKDNIQRFVGEATFFRALEYYRLVKRYGDVPLIIKVLDIDFEELYASRTERTKVVDYILDELDKAIPLLPKQSELSAKQLGRITSGAALALKARVALFEGTWQKYHGTNINVDKYLNYAIEASNNIIISGEYKLYTDPTYPELSFFRLYDYFGDDSEEVILANRYERQVRTTTYTGGDPTKKLADMFLCIDGLPIEKSNLFDGYATMTSEFINRDGRMAQTILLPGTPHYCALSRYGEPYWWIPDARNSTVYVNRKSFTQDEYAVNTWGQHQVDNKMIRYAEVLLIYAEATFEKNGSISNSDLNKSINVLRKRVGVNMPDLTNEFVVTNGLDMRTEIRRERTIELTFEGFRLDDLRRWKTAEIEMPMPIRGVKFQGTEYETRYDEIEIGVYIMVDNDGFVLNETERKFESKHYLFPLPLVELEMNSNLVQNPEWD